MADRPSGTVTFLFTDVEGSTALWEEHPDAMGVALERHDRILRSAIGSFGGYVFSTAGDAFAAAFARAGDAVAAAVEAQRALGAEPWPELVVVRVRMGLHTGEAQERDGDYFGPVLNRAARVMAAGHGGQILVAAPTASVVDGVDLVDLGEHRLKDLAAVEHLFQVTGEGLGSVFAPLRTVDEVPGNLPVLSTSFVGRGDELGELTELVRVHRLVTLTGVGGVGKTRLALQTAAELSGEFPDGVWLVELAPVGDPGAVPDAVAAVLGLTAPVGATVGDSIAESLSGRRLLLVLDNCEHVLDAVCELVELIMSRAETVTLMATSREGLRVADEHVWPVVSLDIAAGADSAAVELFVQRARAVDPGFELGDGGEAVTEICARLDGIALAIELAAARMVSMSPVEVRDRLDDRFRLLSGSRRGLERHQTLRGAVGWSYDLLDADERALLDSCSVFADGFDLTAAVEVCGEGLDEFETLDLLDSLVRKSLVTTERIGVRTRYGLLETIRQFAEDQLVDSGLAGEVRDRHSTHFSDQAQARWDLWDSAEQRSSIDWVDTEFANLRTAFRWATDQGDLDAATAIAAHTAMLGHMLQRREPVGWAEEILDAAATAEVAQLPRLYTAAALCTFLGRPEPALRYAQAASELVTDPRCDPFEPGWSQMWEGVAHLYTGDTSRLLEVCDDMVAQPGFAHVHGLCALVWTLPALGRANDAMAIAEETVTLARASDNAYLLTFALNGYGRAFGHTEPARALSALREGLDVAEHNRVEFWATNMAREAAELEAAHGDPHQALELFDTAINTFHRAGDPGNVAVTLAGLAMCLEGHGQPEIAATIYGASTHHEETHWWTVNLPEVIDNLRTALGSDTFTSSVNEGAAMELADAVHYASQQIRHAHHNIQ